MEIRTSLIDFNLVKNKYDVRATTNSIMLLLKSNDNFIFLEVEKQVDSRKQVYLSIRKEIDKLTERVKS